MNWNESESGRTKCRVYILTYIITSTKVRQCTVTPIEHTHTVPRIYTDIVGEQHACHLVKLNSTILILKKNTHE